MKTYVEHRAVVNEVLARCSTDESTSKSRCEMDGDLDPPYAGVSYGVQFEVDMRGKEGREFVGLGNKITYSMCETCVAIVRGDDRLCRDIVLIQSRRA